MENLLATWKSIAVFLDDTPQGERIGDLAADLAKRCGAHLIGIYGISDAPGTQHADSFARGKKAIDAVIARHSAIEEEKALAVGRRFAAVARKQDIGTEFRVTWSGQPDEDAVLSSLHCDLVILGHPKPPGLPESWSAERLMIASGVPVLIIPDGWNGGTIGTRALVAWNASREARRAIADAMPLLSAAQSVTVLVVNSAKTPQKFGEDPGCDISLYLSRHGAHVDLRQISSDGMSVAETILSTAKEQNTDLIVFGAYSHARSTEAIFGGVTRTLLARTSFPLLLSR